MCPSPLAVLAPLASLGRSSALALGVLLASGVAPAAAQAGDFDPAAYGDVWIHDVDQAALHWLTAQGIDVQSRQGRDALLYATGDEVARLVSLGFQATPLPKAGAATKAAWPTFAELTAQLQTLAAANPAIFELSSLGKSVQGRELWMMRVTDNLQLEEDEPELRYISTMHGDEVVGMQLCLELLEDIAANYGSDPQIDALVDDAELWILPLMNPDGYVAGSRYNAQGFDLNREFPDRVSDPVNDPAGRPIEVQHVMNWGYQHTPVLSANFHGGALVVNYPYDSAADPWAAYAATPDDQLFIASSLVYSQLNGPMFSNPVFPQGITNGVEWYAVTGGMQDWNYEWQGCNDVTIELSNTKWPAFSTIPGFWADNRASMLAYLELGFRGVRGLVTDAVTGQPLDASVTVDGNPHAVYTDPEVGDYHRLLLDGTYDLTVSAPGYQPATVAGVAVAGPQATVVDVALTPGGSGPVPDIDVNGQDGPLTVSSGAVSQLTIGLDPAGQAGVVHDWWITVTNGSATFYYSLPGSWSPVPQPAYVGGLLPLAGFPLFSGPLPPGSWTLTMAVDAPDGVYQGTHADTVDVTSL